MENTDQTPNNEDQNPEGHQDGNDIHVDPGQEQHLPHEAWHVVQQKQGRVKPTMQSDDSEEESEGDE